MHLSPFFVQMSIYLVSTHPFSDWNIMGPTQENIPKG